MDKLKGQSIIAKSEVRRLYHQGAHEHVRDVALRLMEEKHDLERQLERSKVEYLILPVLLGL